MHVFCLHLRYWIIAASSQLVLSCSWQLAASSQQAQLLEQQLAQQLTAGWSDKDSCRRFISDLMETCSESKVHLSSDIVASTAAFLTQKQWWGALEALLRRHALPALAQCPGLVLALVQAGRFSVLPGMLCKVNDLADPMLLNSSLLFMCWLGMCSVVAAAEIHLV